ncbi:hypothetical protein B0H66DRAFT_531106 [Apodospora peruviana]|uniref:Uncharacterized protein n=1 Tax=Apodospora peruviana TaxID=516989 RepID=A0AAE0M7T2_9PEZI|nr:hypothetical protein B0H66DRAFT_531106 [Apodospora peruviana]
MDYMMQRQYNSSRGTIPRLDRHGKPRTPITATNNLTIPIDARIPTESPVASGLPRKADHRHRRHFHRPIRHRGPANCHTNSPPLLQQRRSQHQHGILDGRVLPLPRRQGRYQQHPERWKQMKASPSKFAAGLAIAWDCGFHGSSGLSGWYPLHHGAWQVTGLQHVDQAELLAVSMALDKAIEATQHNPVVAVQNVTIFTDSKSILLHLGGKHWFDDAKRVDNEYWDARDFNMGVIKSMVKQRLHMLSYMGVCLLRCAGSRAMLKCPETNGLTSRVGMRGFLLARVLRTGGRLVAR